MSPIALAVVQEDAISLPGELHRYLRQLRKPTVAVHNADAGVPAVILNDERIGRMAAEHLLEHGVTSFAYIGLGQGGGSVRRRGFQEAIRASGRAITACASLDHADYDHLQEPRRIVRFLRDLPKPVGVLAFNDTIAAAVIDACQQHGWNVPGQVAVIGVDNIEMTERFGLNGATSVDPDVPRLGYEAAALLDKLIRGQPVPAAAVVVDPLGVVARESTDVIASADPELAAVLRTIRQSACDGRPLDQIMESSVLSRRTLERRFRREVGRTPAQEVRRVRLERVRQLLADSDLRLSEIAARTGFAYLSHLSKAFRHEFGITPSAYRQRIRGR